MALNNVYLGTASFSEPDWVGNFYPEKAKSADFLRLYAEKLPTVEIDATYYAIPSVRTVEGWVGKTPENFIIAAKFPRSIVHCGEGPKPDAAAVLMPDKTYKERDKFLSVISLLDKRLGPLLLQFPYFSSALFKSSHEFYDRLARFLDELPKEHRYAVEIRNRHWLTPDFSKLLADRNVALALTDQAWMPHGDEVCKLCDDVTTDFSYIRLIGDRQEIEAITQRWDREVIDRSDRLERWAKLVISLAAKNVKVLAYINNHFAGHAPTTLNRLQALM